MSRFDVLDCEQRSAEWFIARAGRLTGSVADAMLAGADTAKRRDLLYRLVTERLTGQPQEDDGFKSAAMTWGTDHEAEAIAAYEARTGLIAVPVGFVALRDVLAGCSPDGAVGDWEGLVSIKCPKTSTHVGYLRAGKVPTNYLPQCLAELWVTGAQWIDFMSYDPRLPAGLDTFLVRYKRDEKAVADFERKALAFLSECDNELAALQTIGNLSAQLEGAVTA